MGLRLRSWIRQDKDALRIFPRTAQGTSSSRPPMVSSYWSEHGIGLEREEKRTSHDEMNMNAQGCM